MPRKKRRPIKDFMSSMPISVKLNDPIASAIALMQRHRVRHLPVLRGKKVVGVVSDRDIKLVVGLKHINADTESIKTAYTPAPYQVKPSASLKVVVEEMIGSKYGCAIVVDKEKLVGIFTVVDALKALASLL